MLLSAGGGEAQQPMSRDSINSVSEKYDFDLSDCAININTGLAGVRWTTSQTRRSRWDERSRDDDRCVLRQRCTSRTAPVMRE